MLHSLLGPDPAPGSAPGWPAPGDSPAPQATGTNGGGVAGEEDGGWQKERLLPALKRWIIEKHHSCVNPKCMFQTQMLGDNFLITYLGGLCVSEGDLDTPWAVRGPA